MTSPEQASGKEQDRKTQAKGWISHVLDLVPRVENDDIWVSELREEDDRRRNNPGYTTDQDLREQMEWRARYGLDPGNFEEQRDNTSRALDIVPRTETGDIDFRLLLMADRARRRDPERAEELLLSLEALMKLGSAATIGAERQPPNPVEPEPDA